MKNKGFNKYLIDCINFENYIGFEGYPEKEPEKESAKLALLKLIFEREKASDIELYNSYNVAIENWLQGLCSSCEIAFTRKDIIEKAYEFKFLNSTFKQSIREIHEQNFIDQNLWYKKAGYRLLSMFSRPVVNEEYKKLIERAK